MTVLAGSNCGSCDKCPTLMDLEIATIPESTWISPVSTLKSVVFPAPLAPMKPMRSPCSTLKSSWSKMVRRPNVFSILDSVAMDTAESVGGGGESESGERTRARTRRAIRSRMSDATPRPIHPEVSIGHAHLKVADLERAIRFYRDVLGFELTQRYGRSAAFLSAGGYHHHIGLNTWESL